MVFPFSSLLTTSSAMGANAQNDLVYVLLPAVAITLGAICLGSYLTTRVLKKFI